MTSQLFRLIQPPLWRNPGEVQFGAAGPVLLREPSMWQWEVIDALERGATTTELGHIAHRNHAGQHLSAFLTTLRPALAVIPPPLRVRVVVQAGDDELEMTKPLYQASDAGEFEIVDSGEADIAWVLARSVMVPRTCAALMANDSPHVPIVVSAAEIEVGPRVDPGISACMSCIAATQTEADELWPTLAAQLFAKPTPAVSHLVWASALLQAMRLSRVRAARVTESITVSAWIPQREMKHRANEHCGCQSPAGIVKASAPSGLRLVPTTAPAS